MNFPLSLPDLSLLLAAESIVLLFTSEIVSPYYGAVRLKINKKKLHSAAIVMSTMFLATVAIRIVALLLNL